ncbi:MAG: SRPBCC family protein [Myxococcales bacterium]
MSEATASETRAELQKEAEVLSVVTRARFSETPERVWANLLYYEQIDGPPPWLLRAVLPVPVRTVGQKQAVGDEADCEYTDGQLRKRVTEIEPGRLYRFSVVDQRLRLRGIRLQGGSYSLRALSDGSTEIALETRYTGGGSPRWLWAPVERGVCHAFHRHILNAMGRALDAPP